MENALQKKLVQDLLYRYRHIVPEVKDMEFLGTFDYSQANVEDLSRILKTGQYKAVRMLRPSTDIFSENMTLFRFRDGNGKLYYGFSYNPANFLEDPHVLGMAPAIDAGSAL